MHNASEAYLDREGREGSIKAQIDQRYERNFDNARDLFVLALRK